MKKAQTTLEYAVLIICVVAALIAIQVYIKRSAQGRLRSAADELGQQYSPKNTTSDVTTKYSSSNFTKVTTEQAIDPLTGEIVEKTITKSWTGPVPSEAGHEKDAPEVETRSGSETVGPLEKNLY